MTTVWISSSVWGRATLPIRSLGKSSCSSFCLRGSCKSRQKQPSQQSQRRNYATTLASVRDGLKDDTRQKIVILGSGWAGYVLSRHLNPKKYRVVVVSPRSYFIFTPLLNDSAVGTLEFRNVLESVRKRKSPVDFIQGWADDVNFADKTITVEPSVLDPNVGHALTGPRPSEDSKEPEGDILTGLPLGGTGQKRVPTFPVNYDKLVIAVGCYSQTFGIKGVRENAMFLKDVGDAVRIRRRVLELFELAKLPIVPEDTRKHLLNFAIVGGGPTGMEFAASLSDLISEDLSKVHPTLMKYVQITVYDVAPKILPMFDASISNYAVKHYERHNVTIKTSRQVEELRKGFPNDSAARENQSDQAKGRVYTLRIKDEGDVGIGMCVWSTGNMNNPFVAKALDHVRRYPTDSARITEGQVTDPNKRQWTIQRDAKTGAILVDDHFRVQLSTETPSSKQANPPPKNSSHEIQARAIMDDVFALGDTTRLSSGALPATAQVANQQALWLSKNLNSSPDPSGFSAKPGFGFKNLGVMTYIGGSKAVLQGPSTSREGIPPGLKGYIAYFIWRGAYLTMTLSWRNKFLVPVQWLAVKVFGRDISRF